MFLFPGWQCPAGASAVRDDRPGGDIAAICDDRGIATDVLDSGLGERLAVVAIARQRITDCDHELCIGVDDDLMAGGIPIVLRRCSDRPVPSRNQSPVHNQHRVPSEPRARTQHQLRSQVIDDPIGRGLRHTEQGCQLPQREIGPPIRRHQQHPISQRQTPRPTPPHRISTPALQPTHQTNENTRPKPAKTARSTTPQPLSPHPPRHLKPMGHNQ